MSSILLENALQVIQLMNQGKFDTAFSSAKRYTEDRDDDGDCAACLAFCFYFGYGTKISLDGRDVWIKKAVEKGSTLGKGFALCVAERWNEVISTLQPFANGECSLANWMLCHSYLGLKEERKGFEFCEKAANQGLLRGLVSLSFCYHEGKGVSKNAEKGFLFAKEGADKGDASGQRNVAYDYILGEGCTPNEELAFQYIKKAVAQNDRVAQANLGVCYLYGRGCKVNYNLAFHFMKLAADQDDKESRAMLASFYLDGVGCEPNHELALQYSVDLFSC